MDRNQDLWLLPYNKNCLKQTQASFSKVQCSEECSNNYSPVHSKDDLIRSQSHSHVINAKIIILLLLLVSYILSNHCITLYRSTWTESLANLELTLKQKKWLT